MLAAPERGRISCLGRPGATDMSDFRQEFLAFALARDVLKFGNFVTKAGRKTPYFFNAGLFSDGASLRQLGMFYAETILASGLACDQLFGPAYKGIALAAATGIALAKKGHNLPQVPRPEGSEGPRRRRRCRRPAEKARS